MSKQSNCTSLNALDLVALILVKYSLSLHYLRISAAIKVILLIVRSDKQSLNKSYLKKIVHLLC
uniref:Uncharacterized protein n=1 Tax=Amphimedon queenslandica TaxID=400682 RepID=A0A1X7VV18_AMPQE